MRKNGYVIDITEDVLNENTQLDEESLQQKKEFVRTKRQIVETEDVEIKDVETKVVMPKSIEANKQVEIKHNEIKPIEKDVDEQPRQSAFNKELLKVLLILIFLFVMINYIILSVRVDGSSMETTYHNGDRAIMLRTSIFNKPKHYDTVVLNNQDKTNVEEPELIIKRVIALSKDTVEIKDNKVYVNNKEIDDKYRRSNAQMVDLLPLTIPEGYAFVLGDNRNNSRDSRSFGIVRISEFKAVHGLRYWPLNKIGLMK